MGIDLDSFSEQRRDLVLALKSQKNVLLRIKEETIRKKSRAIWLLAGDNNTKYFHRYASVQKWINAVWEMKNAGGEMIMGDHGLKDLAVEHFVGIFSKPSNPDLLGKLKVIKIFPRFFEEEDCRKIYGKV